MDAAATSGSPVLKHGPSAACGGRGRERPWQQSAAGADGSRRHLPLVMGTATLDAPDIILRRDDRHSSVFAFSREFRVSGCARRLVWLAWTAEWLVKGEPIRLPWPKQRTTQTLNCRAARFINCLLSSTLARNGRRTRCNCDRANSFSADSSRRATNRCHRLVFGTRWRGDASVERLVAAATSGSPVLKHGPMPPAAEEGVNALSNNQPSAGDLAIG